jgi:hypothetical protein
MQMLHCNIIIESFNFKSIEWGALFVKLLHEYCLCLGWLPWKMLFMNLLQLWIVVYEFVTRVTIYCLCLRWLPGKCCLLHWVIAVKMLLMILLHIWIVVYEFVTWVTILFMLEVSAVKNIVNEFIIYIWMVAVYEFVVTRVSFILYLCTFTIYSQVRLQVG